MPAPVSPEKREAILADLGAGQLSQKDIATNHEIGLNTVGKIARAAGLNRSTRRATGEQHGSSKLNEEIVRDILRRVKTAARPDGETMTSLALEYDVAIGMISAIASRKRWAHVETDEEVVRKRRVARWREQLDVAQQATGKPLSHWAKDALELMEIALPDDRWIIGLTGCIVIADIPPDGSQFLHARHVVAKIDNATQRHSLLAVLGLPDDTRTQIVITTDQANATIRAWARDQGLDVAATGTIPRHVVTAYSAALERKDRARVR